MVILRMGTKSRFIVTLGFLSLLLLLPGMLSACSYGEREVSPPPTPGRDISRPYTKEPASPANTPAPRLDAAKGPSTATIATVPTVAGAMLPDATAGETNAV